jgi:antitoxin (DNA-binding transcriptional repressor) of toxin-antitoxin stability system
LSDLLNRVRYRGESFLIERAGEPVCRIIPAGPARCTVRTLVHALKAAATPDQGFLDTVEALAKTQRNVPKTSWER